MRHGCCVDKAVACPSTGTCTCTRLHARAAALACTRGLQSCGHALVRVLVPACRWDNNKSQNWSMSVEVIAGEGLVQGMRPSFIATRGLVGARRVARGAQAQAQARMAMDPSHARPQSLTEH